MKLAFTSKVLLAFVLTLAISSNTAFAASKNKVAYVTKKQTPVKVQPVVDPKITVLAGQNLSDLATSNNTTMLRLYYANSQISDPDLIYPGEILTVPNVNEVLTPRALPQQNVVASSVTTQPTDVTASTTPAINNVSGTDTSVWDEIASCESGGNWSIDTGNGFYGGLQFTLSSWQGVGGSGYPNQASASEQIARAEILQSKEGWGAWPACSAKLGL